MALSSYLTRMEWNACYLIGKTADLIGTRPLSVGEIMHIGIAEMHKAGYKFTGIISEENGNCERVKQCCEGNETVLVELMDGTFNIIKRIEETLPWLKQNLSTMDWEHFDAVLETTEDLRALHNDRAEQTT